MMFTKTLIATALAFSSLLAQAQQNPPVGEIKGTAWSHTAESLLGVVQLFDPPRPSLITAAATAASSSRTARRSARRGLARDGGVITLLVAFFFGPFLSKRGRMIFSLVRKLDRVPPKAFSLLVGP